MLIASLRPYVRSRVSPAAPYPPSKPTRRPAHTQSTTSLTSTRRGSLPALHLHTPSQSTPTVSIASPIMQENSENLNDDDYYAYSNLAAFSFGAATTHRQSYDPDTPSPLSVQAASESGHSHGTGSTDRTPRHSVSHGRGSDNEGGEDVTRRTKMRAIDDGGRRPSRPTNLYTSDRRSTDSTSDSSHRYPEASGDDSDAMASSYTFDADFGPGNESGIVDTDVELDGVLSDDASQHTFGLDHVRSPTASDFEVESDGDDRLGAQQCAEWYIVNPNERRHEAGSPVTFANNESEGDDSDVSESSARRLTTNHRNSIAIRRASLRDGAFSANETDLRQIQKNTREREDSAATVRQLNKEDLARGMQVTVTNPNRERQPSLPTPNWSMFTDNASAPTLEDSGSGENVYQGIDLNYIMSVGGLADPGSRRSSHSFIAQPLPLPPPKAKSKDKDKRKKDKSREKVPLDIAAMQGLIGPSTALPNVLDIAPWAMGDEMTGPRRPSTVTLDDSFAGGLRRLDPHYAERRNEWSFIREPERLVVPPRDPEGSPRTWDIWRCVQIGKIRLERATLPPCTSSYLECMVIT